MRKKLRMRTRSWTLRRSSRKVRRQPYLLPDYLVPSRPASPRRSVRAPCAVHAKARAGRWLEPGLPKGARLFFFYVRERARPGTGGAPARDEGREIYVSFVLLGNNPKLISLRS